MAENNDPRVLTCLRCVGVIRINGAWNTCCSMYKSICIGCLRRAWTDRWARSTRGPEVETFLRVHVVLFPCLSARAPDLCVVCERASSTGVCLHSAVAALAAVCMYRCLLTRSAQISAYQHQPPLPLCSALHGGHRRYDTVALGVILSILNAALVGLAAFQVRVPSSIRCDK